MSICGRDDESISRFVPLTFLEAFYGMLEHDGKHFVTAQSERVVFESIRLRPSLVDDSHWAVTELSASGKDSLIRVVALNDWHFEFVYRRISRQFSFETCT